MPWDVFISHATEDKKAVAEPLAHALREAGLTVWYDQFELKLGDRVRMSVEKGLADSTFGIVILSPSFFMKHWTQIELDGLAQREVGGQKVILPIWYNITADKIRDHSPSLADRIAVRWEYGLESVVADVLSEVNKAPLARKMRPKRIKSSKGLKLLIVLILLVASACSTILFSNSSSLWNSLTAGFNESVNQNNNSSNRNSINTSNRNASNAQTAPDNIPNDEKTALMKAAYEGNLNALRSLIDAGVNLNQKDQKGNSALDKAIEGNRLDAIKMLLKGGADANTKNNEGETILIRYLSEYKYSSLGDADRIGIVKLFIGAPHPADVNARSPKTGRTPLIIAAGNPSDLEIIQLLICARANVNAKDNDGQTALMRSKNCTGCQRIAEVLSIAQYNLSRREC
jgi:TIR domain/Ankyrin repeats (3 copies)